MVNLGSVQEMRNLECTSPIIEEETMENYSSQTQKKFDSKNGNIMDYIQSLQNMTFVLENAITNMVTLDDFNSIVTSLYRMHEGMMNTTLTGVIIGKNKHNNNL